MADRPDAEDGGGDLIRRSGPEWIALRRDVAEIKSDVRVLTAQVIGDDRVPGVIPQLWAELSEIRAAQKRDALESERESSILASARRWNASVKFAVGVAGVVLSGFILYLLTQVAANVAHHP